MLTPVQIAQRLPSVLSMSTLDPLVHFVELLALEAVQQDAAERFVEIFAHTCDHFFQDIGVSAAAATVCGFGFVVFVKEQVDGLF